jgi:hypothetical protein
LEQLALVYTSTQEVDHAVAGTAAAHFAALAAGVTHLPSLRLGWPWQDSTQPVLPDLAPLTALTSIILGAADDDQPLGWQPEHVLQVLQGKEGTLLQVSLEDMELVSPDIALMLSERFPLLQRLELASCKALLPQTGPGSGSKEQEEQALLQLKQLLRPGLELRVTHHSA